MTMACAGALAGQPTAGPIREVTAGEPTGSPTDSPTAAPTQAPTGIAPIPLPTICCFLVCWTEEMSAL
jgi:hypothetical protein